jgi:hypothetical protein
MTKIQPLLQRGLTALDPWLDAVFPVATALICAKQRLAGYSLLVIYIALRLLQRSDKEPWRWILISLLVVNAGLIIEDRDFKPGGPSDYLVVALSFAAGFQRNEKHWRVSLAWMALSIVPLLALSLAAGDQMIQLNSSFTGFNINRLGFLAGILSIFSYSLLRKGATRTNQIYAAVLLAACGAEAILTQSRAALAVPIIAIATDQASRIHWSKRRLGAAAATLATAALLTLYSWYGPAASNSNRIADDNRITTIHCWAANTIKKPTALMLGQGYGKVAKEKCGPDKISGLIQRDRPLSHAHNLYIQAFAETGITGLALCIALTLAAFRKAWSQNPNTDGPISRPLVVYLFLMAMGATWHTMMINQVLVGYSLAALTAKESGPAAADAATPPTQPV